MQEKYEMAQNMANCGFFKGIRDCFPHGIQLELVMESIYVYSFNNKERARSTGAILPFLNIHRDIHSANCPTKVR